MILKITPSHSLANDMFVNKNYRKENISFLKKSLKHMK